MNTITVITELCAEDRARLDRLAAALEAQACEQPEETERTETLEKQPQEAPKVEPNETITPDDEGDLPFDDVPTEDTQPTVTLEQIQAKVMQLATANGGAYKAQARAVINEYGTKVSDLKDKPDKWDEVWKKLCAIDCEA